VRSENRRKKGSQFRCERANAGGGLEPERDVAVNGGEKKKTPRDITGGTPLAISRGIKMFTLADQKEKKDLDG